MQRLVLSILFLLSVVGCRAAVSEPRLRPSPYFGSITGISFGDINDLGEHNYESSRGEKNPLLYTAKAGYIDIGHLRESADRARYIYDLCRENILNGNTQFTYEVIEKTQYHVTFEYPEDWQQLSAQQQQDIAEKISIELGQHFAQTSTIWHEIVTWYGYSSIGLLSEQPSSFSWEDTYSDLLGTKLAAKVLRKKAQSYDEAMTEIIYNELSELDPQSPATAKKATKKIEGKWFSGRYPFLTMKKRNFDVGYDDGMISPFRVPDICPDVSEIPCKVPTMDALQQSGFKVSLKMTPHERERFKILKIIYPEDFAETLEPKQHFPKIIAHIRKEALKKSGSEVDTPTLN